MNELKPCPFCGGKAEIKEAVRLRRDVLDELIRWEIICRRCFASGPYQVPIASDFAVDAQRSITNVWNLREAAEPEANHVLAGVTLAVHVERLLNRVHQLEKNQVTLRHQVATAAVVEAAVAFADTMTERMKR